MSASTKTKPATVADTTTPAPAAPKPIRPPKKTEMSLRVEFTRDEIVDLARKQAESYGELNRAEEDKKAVTAQLKAKCDGIAARISELAGKITSGFEYRVVPCETRYDEPKPGLKTTVRLDTCDVVSVDPMSLAERQAELDLDKKQPAEASAMSTEPKLSPDMFDLLTPEQVYVGSMGETFGEMFAGWMRELFVNMDEELCSDDERRAAAAALVEQEPAKNLSLFIEWMRADRPAAAELPGASIAADLISYALAEHNKLAAKKKSAGRVATRRAGASGTVSVDADDGSRDDAGEDNKNNL